MGRLQSIRACLALLAAAYAARALTSEEFDELRSQYSLIQLSLGGGSVTEESAAIYESVMVAIRNNETLSHSRHIWKFVASQTYAPTLSGNGCLYLPSDQAWRSFYEWVEHPYAPMFAEMIRNAWDPDCGTSQLAACPEGHVVGNHWSLLADEAPPQSSVPNMRMPEVFAQGMGCIRTRHASTAGNIRIFEAEGHVGLPSKWMQHVNVAREDRTSSRAMRSQRLQHSRLAQDSCSDSASLPAVPEDKKLVVPTRFIICCVNLTNCAISEAMIKDQVAWMNKGYTGREDWRSKEGAPPHVNTQIEFSLNEFKFVEDAACAKHAFSNTSLATRHNTGGVGFLTYVIMTDDQSGVLGLAEFPQEWQESSQELIVQINAKAFRGWAAATRYPDLTYDEGDTCIHEGGHSLGLFHTFEGGCDDGDNILDTEPEAFPSYMCEDAQSCFSHDPIYNFMDYSPDSCMEGFTEMQKRRLWCMVRHYRPTLYNISLTDRQSDSARGSPTDALKG
mmetsp:Transcript_93380/g.264101  ORF Transcript_93380/g.264101 Transcript_93380/m.264101 type:complete len:504 (-) Transcript_93380:246-1757(-)